MDYIIILAVVLVALAVMGAAWLHFGRLLSASASLRGR
jgi:hypothetical protein